MSILTEADALVNGERQQQYGHPLDQYTKLAGLVNAQFAEKLLVKFSAEDMAVFMVLLKVSRGVDIRDTLVDGAGYFGVIELIQQEREKRAK